MGGLIHVNGTEWSTCAMIIQKVIMFPQESLIVLTEVICQHQHC